LPIWNAKHRQNQLLFAQGVNSNFTDNVHMDAHSYENTTEKNGYSYTFRQLPPINSLRIEVFGITSLSMARK